MAKPREAAIFAAITVILVSIPAASQDVEISNKGDLEGKIDSRFSDQFKIDFNPGEVFMKTISSEDKFEVNKSFRETTKTLQTSNGYIKKVVSNDSIVKTVQTPYGRFKSGVRNGDNFSSFDGGDKEKASDLKNSLEEKFEERSSEVLDKKQVVMSRILPSIELSVEQEQEVEHFNLTNNEESKVDLSGWKVLSKGSMEYTLRLDRIISPGETLTFYSGSKEDVGGRRDAVYGTGLTIYSNDGELTLFNEQEKVVDSYKY
jgi:hypothetical protein